MSISLVCEAAIYALSESFEVIDCIDELPDELKDQRKLCCISEAVAATFGYHESEALGVIYSIAMDDGLDLGLVRLAVDDGVERAKTAIEYRSTVAPPKRGFATIKLAPALAQSTRDLIDWMSRHSPDEFAGWLRDRPDIDQVVSYLEAKKENPGG